MQTIQTQYQPTKASLKTHTVPAWFHDAKLGIMIHYGPYSVPGWANPVSHMQGAPTDGELTPYAEWYQNALRIPGSPTQQYHDKTYGRNFSYYDFGPVFRDELEKVDPAAWTDLIKSCGARYAVLTTKHHDGFNLWPSRHVNPKQAQWFSTRDLVGEVAQALRNQGLRFGAYYSGILDWSFQPQPIKTVLDGILNPPGSLEYGRYCYAQYRELIERYQPDVLWNDIGYPLLGKIKDLLAYYYNTVPEGVINDRWFTWWIPSSKVAYAIVRAVLKKAEAVSPAFRRVIQSQLDNDGPPISFGDFATPEYLQLESTIDYKWEACRGIGSSFGYNQNEDDSYMLTGDELIRLLVDIVSKNGNLLINIGPRADGSIPENQQRPLKVLGKWLKVNGEAIYATRPWVRAEARSPEGADLRFTKNARQLFVFFLKGEFSRPITISGIRLKSSGGVSRLSDNCRLDSKETDSGLVIHLPQDYYHAPVQVARIDLEEIA